MDSLNNKDKSTIHNTNPYCCFFCTMKHQNPNMRKQGLVKCFKELPLADDPAHVLVLSGLWNVAMAHPDDPEFPSLGVFQCMARLIEKGVSDRDWLLKDQNIYIPYYAAHVIGSYTMNKPEFAELAVRSGVVSPLMDLMRRKLTWVEQRVAVRALGHLVSYEATFDDVAGPYEEELVKLTMNLAATCLDEVYVAFVGVKDKNERLKYHSDLMTRGVGGAEAEDRKAEEWARQLQCWCLYLLNCFAVKNRSVRVICDQDRFLVGACGMWGGLANQSSPAGVGLIRILCYGKVGRKSVAKSKQVVESLCNLARSSDDWQYVGIDCLVLLVKDKDTRYKVLGTATSYLADLVELRELGSRSNLGEQVTSALLLDHKTKTKLNNDDDDKVSKFVREIWDLKVDRRKREKKMPDEDVENARVLARSMKRQGNHAFYAGEVEEAVTKYTEALNLCPIKFRKERMVIYSNRAQCHLMLREPDTAISDATRALCLALPANSHGKSLWRRSQAYDMKGLAKESLMDCVMFVNGCIFGSDTTKRVKIPYHAARMISKQMDATWLFAKARSKSCAKMSLGQGDGQLVNDEQQYKKIIGMVMEKKGIISGLSTIIEEPLGSTTEENGRKLERARRRRRIVVARSM